MDRDRSIIAQNAGTTAANLLANYTSTQDYESQNYDSLEDYLAAFDQIRTFVYEGTLRLASESAVSVEDVVSTFPGTTQAPRQGGFVGGGDKGTIEFKSGKHQGKTVAEVAAIDRDYLVWCTKPDTTYKNDYMKRAISEYLAA